MGGIHKPMMCNTKRDTFAFLWACFVTFCGGVCMDLGRLCGLFQYASDFVTLVAAFDQNFVRRFLYRTYPQFVTIQMFMLTESCYILRLDNIVVGFAINFGHTNIFCRSISNNILEYNEVLLLSLTAKAA